MKQKYITTTAYYIAFVLLGLTIAAEGPTLLKLAEHTSSALDQISSIFLFGSLGYLLGSYIGGRLYDRVPGHRFMSGVLICLGITVALVPLAPSRGILFAIVLVLGLFKGGLDVGCNTLLLWVHNETVGPFMNGLHAFFGVGAFIAPLIVAQVISFTGDIYWVYWIFAIAAFPLAVWIWNLPSPESRAVPAHHESAPFPILPVLIMVLCFVLYVGGESGYGAWIYTYAFTLKFGTEVTAAYLTSAFWGSFTLGRLLGIWVSTRARPIQTSARFAPQFPSTRCCSRSRRTTRGAIPRPDGSRGSRDSEHTPFRRSTYWSQARSAAIRAATSLRTGPHPIRRRSG